MTLESSMSSASAISTTFRRGGHVPKTASSGAIVHTARKAMAGNRLPRWASKKLAPAQPRIGVGASGRTAPPVQLVNDGRKTNQIPYVTETANARRVVTRATRVRRRYARVVETQPVPPRGLEPRSSAPEADTLSTELRGR